MPLKRKGIFKSSTKKISLFNRLGRLDSRYLIVSHIFALSNSCARAVSHANSTDLHVIPCET